MVIISIFFLSRFLPFFRSEPVEKGEKTKAKKGLILTIAAGGGHLEAAKVKQLELEEKYPGIVIITRDIALDFIPGGKILVDYWNRSQTKGASSNMADFAQKVQRIAEYLIWIPIFFAMIRLLEKEEIDVIIDTQAFGTNAMIKAIRYMLWRHKKIISFEKVLTELPSKEFNFFAESMRTLSSKDCPFIRFVTTTPLLEEGETEASFWQTYYHLPMDSISYQVLPIRPAFRVYMGKTRIKEEMTFPFTEGSLTVSFDDKVYFLMLGSRPAERAVLQYVQEFMKEKSPSKGRNILLVLCGNQKDLFNKVSEYAKKAPSQCLIIPLAYQGDHIIAPLLYRADFTITRSGGLTSMELYLVATGQILIHTEGGKSGMPIWEWGNFTYLQVTKGALLVTPGTFSEVLNFPVQRPKNG